MQRDHRKQRELLQRIEALQTRLAEAEDVLRAIQTGEADAIVVLGAGGKRVFTLKGAEQPYRILVETMNEGTVTLLPDGTIAYSNRRFAETVRTPLEAVIGSSFSRFLAPPQEPGFKSLLKRAGKNGCKAELTILAGDGSSVPVQLSVRPLAERQSPGFCVVVTDLTQLV